MDALLAHADLPAGSLVADVSAGLGAVALARVARERELACRVYMPETASAEMVKAAREAGAEIRLCPPTSKALASTLNELAQGHESEALYWTRQNFQTCDVYARLAERLTVRAPDHLVAGVGTGSSLRSFGQFFRQLNPHLKVHAIFSPDIEGLRPREMTLDFSGMQDAGSLCSLRDLFGDQLQIHTLSREHHTTSTQAVLRVMEHLANAIGISMTGRT